ncbi:ionotropic receptor 75a-like [Onthophagus taurus]|uniref:ionotropic receptor 75a-like n=1 Tax=Onthophagus taurus TaxID=166361 RepID=UPI0039BDFDB5
MFRNRHIDTELKVQFRKWNNALIAINSIGNTTVTTTWGDYNETTGLFSGMIGDLQSGRSDIGGSSAFILWNRIGVVDYVSAASSHSTCFIYRAPSLSVVSNVFILPFRHSVWAASCGLILMICVTMYVIIKWEYKDEEFLESLQPTSNILLPYFSDVSVLTFGGVCQQGTEAEPRSVSGRLTMLISFIALMFLYTAYSGTIVAMLQSSSETVNSIEAFLYSKIELGVENVTYMPTFFRNLTEPIRKAIYEKKIAPQGKFKHLMDAEAGIKKVREEFFAFHMEPSAAYTIIRRTFQENEKCSLRELYVWTISLPYLTAARNSSYRELIKIGLRKVEETGIHDREYKILYLKKPECQGGGSTFANVGLTECYFAFYIFAIGCVISLVLLGFELIIFKKQTFI